MSAIRERTTLSLSNLPKKLTSRRNLHAHFSKFGECKIVSLDKTLRSGKIQFSTHFGAQAAKTQGALCEGEPLNIFWSECKILDPRAKEKHEYATECDPLWQDDDKECFGVERKPPSRDENKQSAKSMISQHLKLPSVKKRLGSVVKIGDSVKSKDSGIKISPIKLGRPLKPSLSVKKTLSQANKRKLSRKEGTTSDKDKKKVSYSNDQSLQSASMIEQIDLKQKLDLLDDRDKLIRQETIQDSDIKTALAIKGTCPDMCPERERILRQCGHSVAIYEMFPGTNQMDENRAVKEYIRSSADQDVPLPHDLRPAPVLSMTINYLITNVINRADNPDENKAVWYSFCWNRLRSIRKDIILQQLCDLETVTIVEQCARFHICCYDHMLGAEVSGFDDKINTNNLIDCLQTLKHLYEDLAKHNIKCPNEPEFYSYLILLRLTSGDVMWEYQQYSPQIQLSPKVQFAIAAYMAFTNNVYSKYFSLVRRASYLEACLLQRHFDEVRTKALKIMLKAYSLPTKSVGLTTSFLIECLKFDSQKSVIRFCEKVEGCLDRKVEFDGDEDEEDEDTSTSSYLIREKRLSIANAVVGENNPLPIYIPHEVCSSFGVDGKLKDLLLVVPKEELYDDSVDSPLEKSDVNMSEVKPQPLSQSKPFKFCLSPNVTEDVSSKNVFSRLGSFDQASDGFMSTEPSEDSLRKSSSSKLSFGSNETFIDSNNDSFYNDNISESFEMEEEIDEEIVYDSEKSQEAKTVNSQQCFAQLDSAERLQFDFQQRHSSSPTVHSLPINNHNTGFQVKEKQPFKFFPTLTSPNDKTEETFKFSLTPKGETPKTSPLKNITSENISFRSTFQFHPITNEIGDQISGKDHSVSLHTVVKSKGTVDMEHSRGNGDVEKVAKVKEIEAKGTEIVNKEIMETLLMKKAEEERIKMEEISRAKLEKRRKKIEEQKALQTLRRDLRQRLKAINARKYVRVWKNRVEKLKQKRADFPMLHELSVESYIKIWGTMKYIPTTSIFQRAKDIKNALTVISQLLQSGVVDSCKYIGQDVAESLAKSAAKALQRGTMRPVFWKLAMSVPWLDRSVTELSVFNQMMMRCCKQTFYNKGDARLGSVDSVMTSLGIPVYMSFHFSDNLQSCHDLQGMDALIFVVVNGLESEKMCLRRLRNLIASQARSEQFSVSVMTINDKKFDRVLKMELEELYEQNLIAYWTINEWTNPSCILESLKFLIDHVNIVQDVCAKSLESLVRDVLEDFFFTLSKSQCFNPRLKDAFESPNNVISIYNTCLTKLEDLLMSSKLEKYFNFAEEFKTHISLNESGGPELMCGIQYNDQYRSQISKKINSLKLPEFSGWPGDNQIDFDNLVVLVETYCSQKIHDMEVFPRVIRNLGQQEDLDPSLKLNCYSWLYIVEMWADCRIRHGFPSKEKSKSTLVIFNKNDIQWMIKKQWWLTLPIVVQGIKM